MWSEGHTLPSLWLEVAHIRLKNRDMETIPNKYTCLSEPKNMVEFFHSHGQCKEESPKFRL